MGLAVARAGRPGRGCGRADIAADRVALRRRTSVVARPRGARRARRWPTESAGTCRPLVFDASGSRGVDGAAFGLVGAGGTLVLVGHTIGVAAASTTRCSTPASWTCARRATPPRADWVHGASTCRRRRLDGRHPVAEPPHDARRAVVRRAAAPRGAPQRGRQGGRRHRSRGGLRVNAAPPTAPAGRGRRRLIAVRDLEPARTGAEWLEPSWSAKTSSWATRWPPETIEVGAPMVRCRHGRSGGDTRRSQDGRLGAHPQPGQRLHPHIRPPRTARDDRR